MYTCMPEIDYEKKMIIIRHFFKLGNLMVRIFVYLGSGKCMEWIVL